MRLKIKEPKQPPNALKMPILRRIENGLTMLNDRAVTLGAIRNANIELRVAVNFSYL